MYLIGPFHLFTFVEIIMLTYSFGAEIVASPVEDTIAIGELMNHARHWILTLNVSLTLLFLPAGMVHSTRQVRWSTENKWRTVSVDSSGFAATRSGSFFEITHGYVQTTHPVAKGVHIW